MNVHIARTDFNYKSNILKQMQFPVTTTNPPKKQGKRKN